MSAATVALPAISEFAAAVRAALSDLSPDEVDDLTDGLEADLTDRLAESDGQDASDLGDPAAYAEELRTAAGMPHRPALSHTGSTTWQGVVEALREAPREVAATFREFGAAHPSLARLRDFAVSLRPLWWLFRALVVTWLVVNVATPGWWQPINGFTIVVGIAALVLSVQFGRGKWLPFAWMRGVLLALNIILILAAPFIVGALGNAVNDGAYAQSYPDESTVDQSGSGLTENGSQVSNIFAYDAQGTPLMNVQLFDQDGKPLDLTGDPNAPYGGSSDGSTVTVPNDAVTGRPGWNVFPLDRVNQSAIGDDGSIKSSAHRIPADLPFATAKPLAGSETTSAPTPTAMPTPTATPAP
ncbi:MAG: hypothetical protein ABIP33_08800 [Pseudolysinimonas sp.]